MYLIVAGEDIHEASQIMASGRFHQEVDSREREVVLCLGFAKIHKVHTHPLFAIDFFYHYNVCQPVGVVHFSHELSVHELLNFFLRQNSFSFFSLALMWDLCSIHGY